MAFSTGSSQLLHITKCKILRKFQNFPHNIQKNRTLELCEKKQLRDVKLRTFSPFQRASFRGNTFVIEWFAGINCIILWSQSYDAMIQFMPANHWNTNRVITILIHSDKTQSVFLALLRRIAKDETSSLLSWHKSYDFNAANFWRHSQSKCALQTQWIRI